MTSVIITSADIDAALKIRHERKKDGGCNICHTYWQALSGCDDNLLLEAIHLVDPDAVINDSIIDIYLAGLILGATAQVIASRRAKEVADLERMVGD